MADNVRYRPGADNSKLRIALYKSWKGKCYRCDEPKLFPNTEIDHIIPQHTSPRRLTKLKAEYSLPEDFDLDDLQNLAPICVPCNGPLGKGSREFRGTLKELDKLERARELKAAVVEEVLRLGRSGKVAEDLLRASMSDTSNPAARQEFEEYAPAVVQKLALLNGGEVDYISFSSKTVVIGEYGDDLKVGVSLVNRGRAALLILEDVCGCPIEDALANPIGDLVRKVRENVQVAFERIEGPIGPTISGPPTIHFIKIRIDSIEHERFGPSIEFTFNGNFESDLSASLVQDDINGNGGNEVQGDAQVLGTFSFDVAWYYSAEPGGVDVAECWIRTWKENIELGSIGVS